MRCRALRLTQKEDPVALSLGAEGTQSLILVLFLCLFTPPMSVQGGSWVLILREVFVITWAPGKVAAAQPPCVTWWPLVLPYLEMNTWDRWPLSCCVQCLLLNKLLCDS